MNKTQLTEALARKLPTSKAQACFLIETVLGLISDGVNTDGKVTLVGFGTFRRTTRKERIGRNPHTGEPMTLPASRNVRFVASRNSSMRSEPTRVRG